MATQIRDALSQLPSMLKPDLLSLEDAMALDMGRANRLYADHLNRHMLQIFGIYLIFPRAWGSWGWAIITPA
jgi:hypothetical protein